jgi:hypothetical protein
MEFRVLLLKVVALLEGAVVTGEDGIWGSCICVGWLVTLAMFTIGVIGVVGYAGIWGMCTVSDGVMVACITGSGESGEVAGEFT